jgi:N-acetylglucosamine kinase-like BadF-type ATPase
MFTLKCLIFNMTIKTEKFYIGVDSGGTKCDIMLTDGKLNILLNKTYPTLHYSQFGLQKTIKKIASNINNFLKINKLDICDVKGICLGLSGARNKNERSKIKTFLTELLDFRNVIIETDTKTAYYGAFGNENGVVLICGTGSILYGSTDKKFHRVGGWGKILGDYGSGYHIGLEALKEIVKEYDRDEIESLMTIKIEKKYRINRDNIIRKIYHENFPVQNIASLVFECAEKKDRKALRILDYAIDELISHINDFIKISIPKKKIKLAMIGGIVESDNIFTGQLVSKIKKNFKKIEIIKDVNSPAFGAALLANKKYK